MLMLALASSSWHDRNILNTPALIGKQISEKVTDDEVRFVAALGDDSAREETGILFPLDSDRPTSVGFSAMDLHPAGVSPRLLLLGDLERVLRELGTVGDLVAQARPFGTVDLNHSLHRTPQHPSNDSVATAKVVNIR